MRQKHFLKTCVLFVLLAAVLCVPARAFSSEPAGWAAEQCQHLEDVGLLTWDLYTNGTAPTDAINRGDFCQMLVNLIQMEGDWDKIGAVKPVADGYFTDMSGIDVSDGYAMHYGAAYGITEGSSSGGKRIADANSRLTREQAAKMMCALVDALETYGGVPAPAESESRTYADQGSISGWAAEYVARASAMGILKGDSAGKFNPRGNLTWQEACVMVDRAYCSAEEAVIARRAEQGIQTKTTALDLSAEHYLQSSDWLYLLENNGRQSVLYIPAGRDHDIQVETYNANGSSAGLKTIPTELDRCGGFCEGDDAYYLAFGQDNMEESSGKTVFRVVKYDKSWNRLGAADISDCFTTTPFHATPHTAMVEENGMLVLHTARLRYLTRDDNLRHQSNFTAKIRTSDMSVLWTSEEYPDNHVSHSFAQYAAFDNGLPVYVDLGDAYPRGFALGVESSRGSVKQQNFFSFSGAIGDNTTNAVGGGLGVAAGNYLFLGASSPQKGNDSLKKANAFLAVIPKSGGQAQINWLTSFAADGKQFVNDVRLVQLNNNTFVAMWQVSSPGRHFYSYSSVQYAVFDGQGRQVGETKTLPGYVLPNGDPSVYGNRILWARQELDVSDRYTVRDSRYVQIFELEVDLNDPSAQGSTGSTGSTGGTGGTGSTGGNTGGTGSTGSASPDSRYPTAVCEVNGLTITRTNVSDGAQTSYYREDWDGNWLEVSVDGNALKFSGCVKDSSHSRAILAAVSRTNTQEIFITPGTPFTITLQLDGIASGQRYNVSAGTSADGDYAWTTFRSGVSLQVGLDSGGSPALWADVPSWVRGTGSTGATGSTGSSGSTGSTSGSSQVSPLDEFRGGVLRLVNEERAAKGLAALQWSDDLNRAAQLRSKEVSTQRSDTRPDGTKYETVLTELGITNVGWRGELYFWGAFSAPEQVQAVWASSTSPTMMNNIGFDKYTHVGVGRYRGADGMDYCVLLFGEIKE